MKDEIYWICKWIAFLQNFNLKDAIGKKIIYNKIDKLNTPLVKVAMKRPSHPTDGEDKYLL